MTKSLTTTTTEDEAGMLLKDAARYRWLRLQDWDTGRLAVVCNPAIAVKLGHDCPSRQRLDDAIDAEMQNGKIKN